MTWTEKQLRQHGSQNDRDHGVCFKFPQAVKATEQPVGHSTVFKFIQGKGEEVQLSIGEIRLGAKRIVTILIKNEIFSISLEEHLWH